MAPVSCVFVVYCCLYIWSKNCRYICKINGLRWMFSRNTTKRFGHVMRKCPMIFIFSFLYLYFRVGIPNFDTFFLVYIGFVCLVDKFKFMLQLAAATF